MAARRRKKKHHRKGAKRAYHPRGRNGKELHGAALKAYRKAHRGGRRPKAAASSHRKHHKRARSHTTTKRTRSTASHGGGLAARVTKLEHFQRQQKKVNTAFAHSIRHIYTAAQIPGRSRIPQLGR
jgi:NAD/NADP transhydrogenase alpha subunit